MTDNPDRDPRLDLFDTLYMVAINAEIGQRFVKTRDDVGLVYALRRLRGHVVQAIGDLKRIQDLERVAALPTSADIVFAERLTQNNDERSAT